MDDALSREQVAKVASLARLTLTPDELDDARQRLAAVLALMDRLRQIDLAQVEPLTNVGDLMNRLDPDSPAQGMFEPSSPESLRGLAPRTEGLFVSIPKVLGEEPGAVTGTGRGDEPGGGA